MKLPFTSDAVVITGIGGRYPQSQNIEEFWTNLLSGRDFCTDDDSRWPSGYMGLPPKSGKIPRMEKFDAEFFSFGDQQAHDLDPQFRISHETTFEAILDAGVDPKTLEGTRTGLFTGYSLSDSGSAQTECAHSYKVQWCEAFSEVSKYFKFKGPCLVYDSACASSFSAFNEAVKQIKSDVVDAAIVIGVNICTNPHIASSFKQLGMTSAEGVSRCMDQDAHGYVRSETVCSILLQRESDAKRIYARVLNTRTNSDGYKKEGITFPGEDSMIRLMKQTYQEIDLNPRVTKYIEAHVTGTSVGDPVECGAIESVFCSEERTDPLLIGCLKSNIGHAECASGVAAITKACQVMQKRMIPPNINYKTPNRYITGLLNGKLKPVLEATPFDEDIISLNSFGFGGSNVHAIIQRNEHTLNDNINDINAKGGLNRLVLYKSRTEEGFKRLEEKITAHPHLITTEFLSLIDIISNLSEDYDLPVQGYFILNQNKEIVKQKITHASKMRKKIGCKNNFISVHHSHVVPDGFHDLKSSLEAVGIDVNYNELLDNDLFMELSGPRIILKTSNEIVSVMEMPISGDKILSLIGEIYIRGYHEIRIANLYPKIMFPISSSTESLSSLITWNHDKDWAVYKVPDHFRLHLNNRRFHFDYASDYSHLCGHVIDGRTIVPASLYLWSIWQSMAIKVFSNTPTAFLSTGIKFWDVKLNRAIIVNAKEEISIITSTNDTTGAFEIKQGESCLVQGFAQLTFDEDVPPIDSDGDYVGEKISKKDFYKEFRTRGYDYEDDFQGVKECNLDGSGGVVSFKRNWICFCDAVLQLLSGNIRDKTRRLLLPTGFEYFQVDAKQFRDIATTDEHEYFKDVSGNATHEEKDKSSDSTNKDGKNETVTQRGDERLFNVTIVEETQELFTDGLYVKGIKGNAAPRKKVTPVVQNLRFCPFDEDIEEDDSLLTLKHNYDQKCLSEIKRVEENAHHDKKTYSDSNNNPILDEEITDAGEDTNRQLKNILRKIEIDNESLQAHLAKNVKELAGDFLLKVSNQMLDGMKHQFQIISNCFRGQLSITEINLSLKSSFQEEIKTLLSAHCTGTSYSLIDSQESIEKFSKHDSLNSELVLIQHPSMGFSFLDIPCAKAVHCVTGQFAQVIGSTVRKLVKGGFVMIIGRNHEFGVENHFRTDTTNHAELGVILSVVQSEGLVVISTKNSRSHISILARKVEKRESSLKPNIFNIESFNYEWVDELRDKMFITEREGEKIIRRASDSDPIWIVSKGGTSGLEGFINCVRHEDKRFHGIWIMDDNVDIKNVVADCVVNNLPINYIKNNKLGSMFAFPEEHQLSIKHQNSHLASVQEDRNVSQCLDIETKGDLSSLKYQNINLPAGDMVVNVHYSALNFKDVMVASGRVPLTAYPPSLTECNSGELGMEFSGIRPGGERVMGLITTDGIATRVSIGVASDFLWDVPDNMTLEEAATIPVVYSTVYYALIMRGKLVNGERVLIHAGSGGVGQAAINVCLSMGCEIFTTVGTREKREFIKNTFPSITDDHIFDSRSVSFADNVLIATNGRGVDIVLNSLSEEKLQAGLTCLGENGRFIEIGKYDMINNSSIDPVNFTKNQSFESVCLAFFITKVFSYRGEGILPEMKRLRILMDDGIKSGVVKPLSRHIFDWDQAEEAFRFMAAGKHMGKILLKMPQPNEGGSPVLCKANRISFDPKMSYLVIGGLGGMGLEICHWLVKKGVRNMVITSRTGIMTPYHKFVISRLESFGCDVHIKKNDVSINEEAEDLIDFASKLGPVGGVFNLAMVLRDALFENQTKEMFEECCRIKVRGTKNLDEITRERCPHLEHFVCFSSLAASYGNAGQSNYGFANAFMESLCQKRKSDNLPALSIGWGAVGDVGHVAEKMGNDIVIAGSFPQRINSCLEVLARVLTSGNAVVTSYVPQNISGPKDETDILGTILNVLGVKDYANIDMKLTLGDLGLDSLMAVEIKQIMEKSYDKFLSTKEIRELSLHQINGIVSGINVEAKMSGGEDLRKGFDVATSTFEELNNGIDKEPIFIFPGLDGKFVYLITVITELSMLTQRPLIGVNWTADNDQHESIEEVAISYIDKMAHRYPELATYDIIGCSFGALIALEIAIRRQSFVDRRIRKLILLDFSPSYGRSYLAGGIFTRSDEKSLLALMLNAFTKQIAEGSFSFDRVITKMPEFDSHIMEYIKKIRSVIELSDEELVSISDRIRKKFKMVRDYNPNEKLNQDIKLIRAKFGFTPELEQSMAHDYDLSEITSAQVEVTKLDGDHISFLRINAQEISNEIIRYFDK